jgi:hypothetical protein
VDCGGQAGLGFQMNRPNFCTEIQTRKIIFFAEIHLIDNSNILSHIEKNTFSLNVFLANNSTEK